MSIKKCKVCGAEANYEEDLKNFCKDKNHPKGYRNLCKKCKSIQSNKYITSDKGKNTTLKNRYGMTLEEYRKMYEKQNGKCLICEKEGKLDVDHNHSTGEIRGLLCNACNRGIGFLKDSPINLLRGYNYLLTNGFYEAVAPNRAKRLMDRLSKVK